MSSLIVCLFTDSASQPPSIHHVDQFKAPSISLPECLNKVSQKSVNKIVKSIHDLWLKVPSTSYSHAPSHSQT